MNWKKTIIVIILISVLFSGVCALLFAISKSRTFQFFGDLTARVNTNEKVVALTFDDAPTSYTSEVLQTLQDKNIKATFFMIGANIEQYPNEAKLIVDSGMEVGNHSYSHERFLLKSNKFIKDEIERTNNLIRNLGYTSEITFRPPNGKKLFSLPWYLMKHNIKTIMWDVEPDTYVDVNKPTSEKTEFIVSNVIENTKPGSIILIHPFCEACESDRQAIPQIIDKLKSDGYSFVTISELLKYKN